MRVDPQLLAAVFRAEAEQYAENGQETESWLMNWAADVATEPEERLRERLFTPWLDSA